MQIRVYNLQQKVVSAVALRESVTLTDSKRLLPEKRDPALAPAILATELHPGAQHDVCFIPMSKDTLLERAASSQPPPLDLAISTSFSRPTRYADLGWSRVTRATSGTPGAVVYGASALAESGFVSLGDEHSAVASPLHITVERSFAGRIGTALAVAEDGNIGKGANADLHRLSVLSVVRPGFWVPARDAAKVRLRLRWTVLSLSFSTANMHFPFRQAALLRASVHVRLSVPYWVVNRSGLDLRIMSRASRLPVAGSRAARAGLATGTGSRLAVDPAAATPGMSEGLTVAQPTSSHDREVLAAATALLEPEVRYCTEKRSVPCMCTRS